MTFNLSLFNIYKLYLLLHGLLSWSGYLVFNLYLSPPSLSLHNLAKKKKKKENKCRQWMHLCSFIYFQNLLTLLDCWLIIMFLFFWSKDWKIGVSLFQPYLYYHRKWDTIRQEINMYLYVSSNTFIW